MLRNIVIPYSTYRMSLWSKMLVTISLPPPNNESQWSVNDFWPCLLRTLRSTECCYPIFKLSASFMGKNSIDDISSSSFNSAPTECQQFVWGLNKLHRNHLHCVVPDLSLTQSVFAICYCMQLCKYACNVTQI